MISKDTLIEQVDNELAEEQFEVRHWLSEAEIKYEPFLEACVRFHLSEIKKLAESKIEALEAKYDDLTKAGAPFSEKMAVGRQLERAHATEKQCGADLANLVVIPLRDWVEYGDIVQIKKDGFKNALGRPEILFRTYEKTSTT